MLMPFETNLTQIYEYHIKKIIEEKGYIIERADDLYISKPVLEDITKKIIEADIIIADLTGLNPNVFYEVGYAHAKGKYVIQICQRNEELPFDLRNIRTIFYENNPKGYDELKINLIKYLNSCPENLNLGRNEKNHKELDYELIERLSLIIKNIKTKGNEYHTALIGNSPFSFLLNIIDQVFLEISLVNNWEQYQENEALYDFIEKSIKLRPDQVEQAQIFRKYLEVVKNKRVTYNWPFYDSLKELSQNSNIKQIYKENLQNLITLFINSESFKISSILSEILLELNDKINEEQLIQIANGSLDNNQIYNAGSTVYNLNKILSPRITELSPDLVTQLEEKKILKEEE